MIVMKSRTIRNCQTQKGGALIIMALILLLTGTAVMFSVLDASGVKIERDKKTAASLSEAKVALIAWSVNSATPGQLPCPENTLSIGTISEGTANTTCTLPAIGRLPWKSLGIGDLRDGSNEELWYAISAGFRTSPINSDTPAQLTVDGVAGDAVAIIFSPGAVIGGQNRPPPTSVAPPNVVQYLEGSNNDGDNTFVTIGAAGSFNDRLLSITHDELFAVVEKRVVAEVSNALLDYFCGVGNANYATKVCIASGGNRFFPRPSAFSDTTCFGAGTLATSDCLPNAISNHGRLTANPIPAWTATSILRRISTSNWFQENGWRELIHYSVAPACTNGTLNCNGTGFLTLNQALITPIDNKNIVVTATGGVVAGQVRTNNAEKSLEINYLEDENLTTLNDIYTRIAPAGIVFNDHSVSIPW